MCAGMCDFVIGSLNLSLNRKMTHKWACGMGHGAWGLLNVDSGRGAVRGSAHALGSHAARTWCPCWLGLVSRQARSGIYMIYAYQYISCMDACCCHGGLPVSCKDLAWEYPGVQIQVM